MLEVPGKGRVLVYGFGSVTSGIPWSWGAAPDRAGVNLLPDYERLTPFLKAYLEHMGWDDLNWLEDVHMGYEEGRPAVFDRNINGWVTIPADLTLPDNQQDRDMIARELLIKFQMSPKHPLVQLNKAYRKF